jgi:hypothetical protein
VLRWLASPDTRRADLARDGRVLFCDSAAAQPQVFGIDGGAVESSKALSQLVPRRPGLSQRKRARSYSAVPQSHLPVRRRNGSTELLHRLRNLAHAGPGHPGTDRHRIVPNETKEKEYSCAVFSQRFSW